ncbi:MAG: hypothetical protein ACPGJV_05845 [Bacteriovoracaceae bacterium]
MSEFTPSYQAKIIKNGRELYFDFSHLSTFESMEDLENLLKENVREWCSEFPRIAKNCSSFIARLPEGKLMNVMLEPPTKILQ